MRNTLRTLLIEVRDLKHEYSHRLAELRGFAKTEQDGKSLEDFYLTMVDQFNDDQVACYIDALREEKQEIISDMADATLWAKA